MLRVDARLCVMPLPLLYSVSQFNIHLLLQVFTAISDELRAKSNAEYASKGKHRYAQLDFVTSLPHISWTKPHTRCLILATHSILPPPPHTHSPPTYFMPCSSAQRTHLLDAAHQHLSGPQVGPR